MRGYPALVDEGSSVALRIEATPEAAARATRAGVRRLLLLAVPSPASYVLEHLTANEKLALAASPYPSAKALVEDAASRWRMPSSRAPPPDAARCARAPLRRGARPRAVGGRRRRALPDGVADRPHPDRGTRGRPRAARAELADAARRAERREGPGRRARLPRLRVPDGVARLAHVPRYLRGALERVEGLADNPGRDRQRMTEFERAAARLRRGGRRDPACRRRTRPPSCTRGGCSRSTASACSRSTSARPSRSRCSGSRSRCGNSTRSHHEREVGPAMAEAIVYTEFGGPEVLHSSTSPTRSRAPGEVAVRVEAAGVNPIDGKLRAGLRASGPITEPRRVGGDGAGVVTAVGDGCRRLPRRRRGRRLRRLRRLRDRHRRARRERAPASAAGQRRRRGRARHPRRHRLSVAALARRRPGDTLLVHGGSGAVGQAAIQFAVLWGATVIATASERRFDRIRELGATPVAYGEGLADRVRAARRRASPSRSMPPAPTRRIRPRSTSSPTASASRRSCGGGMPRPSASARSGRLARAAHRRSSSPGAPRRSR